MKPYDQSPDFLQPPKQLSTSKTFQDSTSLVVVPGPRGEDSNHPYHLNDIIKRP